MYLTEFSSDTGTYVRQFNCSNVDRYSDYVEWAAGARGGHKEHLWFVNGL